MLESKHALGRASEESEHAFLRARGEKKRRSTRGRLFAEFGTLDDGDDARATLHRPINDAVRPCLIQIAYLGYRDRKPPVDVASSRARELLGDAKKRLEALRLSAEDVSDIMYALVAFTDEVMQLEPGPLKDFWQGNLLQLEYFGETRAGEGFFERLDRIKEDRRLGVMRSYQLCLLFGFHGIYANHGELERENLMESLRRLLHDAASDRQVRLSPHGHRPDEPGAERERNALLQWLAAGCALMGLVWYVGILFTVHAQERALAESLQRAYEDLKLGVVVAAP